MTRFITAIALAALATPLSIPAFAQTTVETVARNTVLWDAGGKRVGKVNRVHEDGSVSVIVGEKLVRVPSSSLTSADGKLTTSMTLRDLKRS